jgi:hypothetical protein
VNPSIRTPKHKSTVPPAGLAPGWPRAGLEGGGSPAARVSRHVGSEGVADQGQGSMSFSRRVLHMDPCPWPAPSKAADATGYPLPHVLRQRHTSLRLVILVHAPRVPVPTGTHGESPALADRSSLTVHGNTSLLTPRGSPDLCKAVLPPLSGAKSASAAQPKQTCRRRHAEADLRDSRHQRQAQPRSGWLSVASHRPPPGATT